jgi:Fe2+ transport system protein FeoA
VVIASAVADALAELGIGEPAARPEEEVPIGPRFPVRLRAKTIGEKVKLRWTPSPGADGYRVLIRHPATSKAWRKVGDTTRRRLTVRGLTPGKRVQFAVLPRKGRALAELDVRSNRVSLRP